MRAGASGHCPYTSLFRSLAAGAVGIFAADVERGLVDQRVAERVAVTARGLLGDLGQAEIAEEATRRHRSEEHTDEIQTHHDLECRLQLEKKNRSSMSEEA